MRRKEDGQQGGTRPGGLTDTGDIKVLICSLLKNLGNPLTREQLDEALPGGGMVSYFEYSQAFSALEQGGQIQAGEQGYRITSLGRHSAEVLEDTIPPALRERSLHNAIRVLRRGDVLRENRVQTVTENGQVFLVCQLMDGDKELMSVKTAVGSPEIAAALEKGFLQNPEILYKAVFASLSGDTELMSQLLSSMKHPGDSI